VETLNRNELENQLLGLSTLLQLEREARAASTEQELGFVMVNETRQLLEYHQAVLWGRGVGCDVKVLTASGVAMVERNAPFVVWLQNCLSDTLRQDSIGVSRLTDSDVPERYRSGWREWTSGQVLLCPLRDRQGVFLGGLWFSRSQPWSDAEVALVERVGEAYAHAWSALVAGRRQGWRNWRKKLASRKVRLALVLLFVAAMFLPVRQSALAPAEVIARDPVVVAAPIDGILEQMHVRPNAGVAVGDLLFSMDDTVLRNRHQVATKALAVAKADYLRASQKAFSDEVSKGEVALLRAEVERKSAEVTYTADLLQRVHVRAARAGTAVYNDPNDWVGRPLETGVKVLSLADPHDTELKIWLPVEDAINLEQGAEISLFLNTDPASPVAASLKQTSYQAEVTEAGVLAFPLLGRFSVTPAPRLGLTGTAKLYGTEVRLFYYLMRRPIAALRRIFGL
jgi:hypothetical protein